MLKTIYHSGDRIKNQTCLLSILSPPKSSFISNPFEGGGGGLIETWGLCNLQTTMVSVLHRTRVQSGKAQVQELEVLGHAAEDQNQIQTSSW